MYPSCVHPFLSTPTGTTLVQPIFVSYLSHCRCVHGLPASTVSLFRSSPEMPVSYADLVMLLPCLKPISGPSLSSDIYWQLICIYQCLWAPYGGQNKRETQPLPKHDSKSLGHLVLISSSTLVSSTPPSILHAHSHVYSLSSTFAHVGLTAWTFFPSLASHGWLVFTLQVFCSSITVSDHSFLTLFVPPRLEQGRHTLCKHPHTALLLSVGVLGSPPFNRKLLKDRDLGLMHLCIPST